jgi:hypothetical protein
MYLDIKLLTAKAKLEKFNKLYGLIVLQLTYYEEGRGLCSAEITAFVFVLLGFAIIY